MDNHELNKDYMKSMTNSESTIDKRCYNCSFAKYCEYKNGECYDGKTFKKWMG